MADTEKHNERVFLNVVDSTGINENGTDIQKYLKRCYKQQTEPVLTFSIPRLEDGTTIDESKPVGIYADDEFVGYMDEDDRNLFNDHMKQVYYGYVRPFEYDDMPGQYGCDAVLVVKTVMNAYEKRRRIKNKLIVAIVCVVFLFIIGSYKLATGDYFFGAVGVLGGILVIMSEAVPLIKERKSISTTRAEKGVEDEQA